jgi:hypothetical protein
LKSLDHWFLRLTPLGTLETNHTTIDQQLFSLCLQMLGKGPYHLKHRLPIDAKLLPNHVQPIRYLGRLHAQPFMGFIQAAHQHHGIWESDS